MTRIQIKEKAKSDIHGRLGGLILAHLIPIGVLFVGSLLSALLVRMLPDSLGFLVTIAFALLGLFVATLMIGMARIYLEIVTKTNYKADYKVLFRYFKCIWNYLFCSLLVALYIFFGIWLILPAIRTAIRYSILPYIFSENPDIDYREAMAKAKELMIGNIGTLFFQNLSFIGWVMLAPFTFGILYFWLIPYMQAATANFYLDIQPQDQNYGGGFQNPSHGQFSQNGYQNPYYGNPNQPPCGNPYGNNQGSPYGNPYNGNQGNDPFKNQNPYGQNSNQNPFGMPPNDEDYPFR